MRKIALLLITCTAIIVAAACSSGGGGGGTSSPTPTSSPLPGSLVDYTATGTGFSGQNGKTVGLRVVEGANVVYCSTSGNITGNNFTVTATSALAVGHSYHGEAFVSIDGNATYDAGDPSFYDPATNTAGTFTVTSARTWAVANGQTQPISWPMGTGCP